MKSHHSSDKPIFLSLNRKLSIGTGSKNTESTKHQDILPDDEEYNTINEEFNKQHKGFQRVIKALYAHLQYIKNSPQSLLEIGNAFLEFYNPEDDVYNHALQFRSACQIKQMTEDEYCAAYEILYSNANSCIIQYLELKERRKKLKNRKSEWELAVRRVEDQRKRKNQKMLAELEDKAELANITFHELRNEVVRDMCLMMNMVVKYRTILFKACVECETKRRDGVNEALSIIKRFGGEDGATPLYVITRDEDSFIHESKCRQMFEKLKRNGEKYKVEKIDEKVVTATPPVVKTPEKVIPNKSLPSRPKEPSVVSQEIQFKNDIINSLRSEIFADNKKKESPKENKKESTNPFEDEEEEKKEVVEEKKSSTPVLATAPTQEVEVKKPTEVVEEKKEEPKEVVKEEVKQEVKEEEPKPVEEKKEEPKEVVQTEPKQEPKEEIKEEVKEEPKQEAPIEQKEEPKEEVKEEVKEEPKQEEIQNEPKEEVKQEKEVVEEKKEEPVVVEETPKEKEAEKVKSDSQSSAKSTSSDSSYDHDDEEQLEAAQTTMNSIEIKTPSKPIMKVKALYDYEATDETELSMREGDIIDIYDNSGDWWMAELNGNRGVIPANFIDFI